MLPQIDCSGPTIALSSQARWHFPRLRPLIFTFGWRGTPGAISSFFTLPAMRYTCFGFERG